MNRKFILSCYKTRTPTLMTYDINSIGAKGMKLKSMGIHGGFSMSFNGSSSGGSRMGSSMGSNVSSNVSSNSNSNGSSTSKSNMTSIILQTLAVLGLVLIGYWIYTKTKSNTIYEKSDFDDRKYLVQNLNDKEEASYMLGVIRKRMLILRNYLVENIDSYPKYKPYILQLSERLEDPILTENSPGGKYTSYTVNKGEEIALCLRSKRTNRLEDINLVMYVTLHEMAHVACPELDHTALFTEIFIFFIKIATQLSIYTKSNYEEKPEEYCGLVINEHLV